LQASRGQDELLRTLVAQLREVRRVCGAALVLGSDYASITIPDELGLNARLANEFGALVLPVIGALSADAVADDVRNAYRAFVSRGCGILAMAVNRISPSAIASVAARFADGYGGVNDPG